jgi:hypothetical protein
MVLIYLLSLVLERNKAYVKKYIKPYEWEYEEWAWKQKLHSKAKDAEFIQSKIATEGRLNVAI